MRSIGFAWFKVHLSTAIVLAFITGGLIWVNMCPRWIEQEPSRSNFNSQLEYEYASGFWLSNYGSPFFGWPFVACQTHNLISSRSVVNGKLMAPVSHQDPATWYFYGILLNIGVAIIIVGGIWYVCEHWKFGSRTHAI